MSGSTALAGLLASFLGMLAPLVLAIVLPVLLHNKFRNSGAYGSTKYLVGIILCCVLGSLTGLFLTAIVLVSSFGTRVSTQFIEQYIQLHGAKYLWIWILCSAVGLALAILIYRFGSKKLRWLQQTGQAAFAPGPYAPLVYGTLPQPLYSHNGTLPPYGAPAMPNPAYGQPVQAPYGQPQQYGQPAQGPYGQPQQYGQPAQGPYGQPQQYGQPAQGLYGQPQQYGQPGQEGPFPPQV